MIRLIAVCIVALVVVAVSPGCNTEGQGMLDVNWPNRAEKQNAGEKVAYLHRDKVRAPNLRFE